MSGLLAEKNRTSRLLLNVKKIKRKERNNEQQ